MKGCIAVIVVSLLLLVCNVLLMCWLNTQGTEMIVLCEEIQSALPEDPDAAQKTIDLLSTRWNKASLEWQYVAIHDDMHQISDALVEMDLSMRKGEIEDVLMHCAKLKTAIYAVMDKEIPSLENIL